MTSPLDTLAQRLERRAEITRLLREAERDDAGFFAEIRQLLASPNGQVAPRIQAPAKFGTTPHSLIPMPSKPKSGSTFDRVSAWFQENDNQWATVATVADALGLNQNTTGHLIYRSRKTNFESRPVPGAPRGREFRLAQQEGG